MDALSRIREVISDKSLNLKEFSKETQTPYRTVQRYLAGDRSISADFLQAMTDHMDVSASWILSGVGGMYVDKRPVGPSNGGDFVAIPRFEVSASAGDGALIEGEPKEGYCAFSATWLQWRNLKPDQLSVISVVGDSMEPELFDNDLILLDRACKDPRRGGPYVVHYAGELYVKRIQVLPGDRVRLISSNKVYDPIEVEPTQAYDFSLIGRVVATMHEW